MRRTVLLPLLLFLAACANPEKIAADLATADDLECRELGFRQGTEGYGNCRLELRSIRAQEAQARALERDRFSDPYWGPWGPWPYWR